jgi:hypothetical protein
MCAADPLSQQYKVCILVLTTVTTPTEHKQLFCDIKNQRLAIRFTMCLQGVEEWPQAADRAEHLGEELRSTLPWNCQQQNIVTHASLHTMLGAGAVCGISRR